MAEKTNDQLDELAFELYKHRSPHLPPSRSGKPVAADCYRKAADFIETQKEIRSGRMTVAKPLGPQLADVSAPNMPANYPLNIVARNFQDRKGGDPIPGDLARAARYYAWLQKNPVADDATDTAKADFVNRLVRTFPELTGWDAATAALARATFKPYCEAA